MECDAVHSYENQNIEYYQGPSPSQGVLNKMKIKALIDHSNVEQSIHTKTETSNITKVRAPGCPSQGVLNKMKIKALIDHSKRNRYKHFYGNSSLEFCDIRPDA